MDAGADVLTVQALLLKVFLLVGGASCSEYVRALSASIVQWSEYERVNHPCWQVFEQNANAFNEESGEISLSALARELARTGVRSDCQKVSQSFKLVKAKAEVAADIGVDISGDDFGSDEHGRRIDPHGEEVKATAAFFSGVIRHVLAGQWRHFGSACGRLDKDKKVARTTVAMAAFPHCFRSVAAQLDGAIGKVRSITGQFWVADFADIWPAAMPTVNFDSDGEDGEQGAGAGAGQAAGESKSSKRKAGKGAAGSAPAEKKAKKASGADLVGCVVAVPAWKFGAVWAGRNFERSMKAVLIGDVTVHDPNRPGEPFSIRMRGDSSYILFLKQKEVEEFRLEGAAAVAPKDTPWKHGAEVE